MASAGICNTAFAILPPITPRKVCKSPILFQRRARLSSRSLSPVLPIYRGEGLPGSSVERGRFSGGERLGEDSRASRDGYYSPICLPNDSLIEYTAESLDKKSKLKPAVNTQDAMTEEHALSRKVNGKQVSREPSISAAEYEDKGMKEAEVLRLVRGHSTHNYRLGQSTFSTRSRVFLQVPCDHLQRRSSKKVLMNEHKAFATTTTFGTARAGDEEKMKQKLQSARDTVTKNGEENAPLLRLARSTVFNKVDKFEISADVRQAMRTVPQPVCIITSTDMSTGTPVFRGATISSFNTVTIEPTTIVSLNIKRPSSTFDAIESSSYFVVHLLKADQANSDLAKAFTKGNSTDPFRTLKKASQTKLPNASRQVAVADAGPPLIEDCTSPGRLLCRYLRQKTVRLGDHVVVFGIVERVTKLPDNIDVSQVTCLTYANGQYGAVHPLEHSSASKISKAALDDFLSKLELMDHSCLRTTPWSYPYLNLLSPEINVSLKSLRSRSEDLFRFLANDEMLKPTKSHMFNIGFRTRPMSSLSEGILRAITFYQIFVASMRGTDFSSFEVPLLSLEVSGALQEYQMATIETYHNLTNIGHTLQELYDPQSTYQPPVSEIYSISKLRSETLDENLRSLNRYLAFCFTPLAHTERITAATPVLQRLVAQYNATLRTLQDGNHQMAHEEIPRINNAPAIRPNAAHAQARAAIMQIYREDILPSWVKSAAKKAEHQQNKSESFLGLGDELMSWLRQYCEICKETAKYLHRYKAFLLTTGLGKYYDKCDEARPSFSRLPSGRVSDAVLRKRFGRRLLASSTNTVRRPLWRVQPTLLVRHHLKKPDELVSKYKRNEDLRVSRRDLGQPLAAREVRLKLRPRFLDPYARLAEEADRQEEAIQRGLEDLEKMMAAEVDKRSK